MRQPRHRTRRRRRSGSGARASPSSRSTAARRTISRNSSAARSPNGRGSSRPAASAWTDRLRRPWGRERVRAAGGRERRPAIDTAAASWGEPPLRYVIGVSMAWALLTLAGSPASAQQGPFRFQEATIASIHAALAAGQLTCTQLTRLYLDRSASYDMQGPALHAIITVNPRAMEIAAEMDRSYRANPASAGPLHCIPVILKDNFNTFDMPTSGGNVSMKTSVPPADAFTVARIRDAGALILAKANMQEFARGGMAISSLGGQVRNPYDLGRTPGGSSGGTGAAIAANFAVLGTGSDTGQSIRSPASANNPLGTRPPRRPRS